MCGMKPPEERERCSLEERLQKIWKRAMLITEWRIPSVMLAAAPVGLDPRHLLLREHVPSGSARLILRELLDSF